MFKLQKMSVLGMFLVLVAACSRDASELPHPSGESEERTKQDVEPRPAQRRLPPPTENYLDADAERAHKKSRKQWIKSRHRSADTTDWQSMERENGRLQIQKRNQLAKLQLRELADARWVERGSENQAGRMHVAAPSADGVTLYAGSALGGIWKGSQEGTEWTPIGDNLYGGAHHLLVLPSDADGGPEVVLAATDAGLIHRSADGGLSWTEPAGLPWRSQVRRLLRMSDASGHIFLLITEAQEQRRLYRSDNDGASFEVVFEFGSYLGDVWVPRDGGSDVFIVSNGRIFRSIDYGEGWEELGEIAPGSIRAELVGSESGAPRLYAVVLRPSEEKKTSLYRSDDAGESWSYMHPVTDYWQSLNASIVDPDLLAWGGVEVHVSKDGAETFDVVNPWRAYYDDPVTKLHADIPGIDVWVDATGAEVWYVSTDGGLFRSDDGLDSVENLSLRGLRVSQYYSTLTSKLPPYTIAAGAQDQGYQLSYADENDERFDFEQWISGDYGHLSSSNGSHDWVFSTYPGFIMIHQGMGEGELSWANFPEDEIYSWLPPVIADPENSQGFYFCASKLYYYRLNDNGVRTWWGYELASDFNFSASEGEYLSALEFSPLDARRVYAATNFGRLFVSNDKGVTWETASFTGPLPQYYYGTALHASRTKIDEVWVGGSGYDNSPVFRSDDGGLTWNKKRLGLPKTLVYSLTEAPDGSGRIFAGTETAAYEWRGEDEGWQDITGADAPVTIYWSAEPLSQENTIRFGTYGRGIWDYQLDPDGEGCFPVRDGDEDGFDCQTDCDDSDAMRSPGLEEVCGNGIDDDCDGGDLACDVEDEQSGCSGGCNTMYPSSVPLLGVLLVGGFTRRRAVFVWPTS